MNILTANLLFSTLVFWIAARFYVFPKLDDLKTSNRSTADSSPAFSLAAECYRGGVVIYNA